MTNYADTKPKCIFSGKVARRLLKLGERIIDVKPNRDIHERTVFVFAPSETFNANMETATRETTVAHAE